VADGGAMVLQKAAPELLPELILGDFDSAKQEILQHYRDRPSGLAGGRKKKRQCFFFWGGSQGVRLWEAKE